MRKPLIVIIVTLSLVCTLKDAYQYNTNDQSNACMCQSLQSFNCYSCYSSQKSQKWCLWLLCNTAYRVLYSYSICYSTCYSCQKGWKCQILCAVLCIQGLLPLPGRKAIWAFHLGGLVVHHQSVQGGSFVNFLGLVKLQGWLQAKHTANPQFLKLRGAQQPSNS